jgi:HPt (histidine-containing phosphotransfer) domain-containing protein
MEHLNDFTDCSLETEQQFLALFVSCAEESMVSLQNNCHENCNEEEWQSTAHSLKGGAANLGAEQLADICFEAEANPHVNLHEHKKQLENIQNAVEEIKKIFKIRHG